MESDKSCFTRIHLGECHRSRSKARLTTLPERSGSHVFVGIRYFDTSLTAKCTDAFGYSCIKGLRKHYASENLAKCVVLDPDKLVKHTRCNSYFVVKKNYQRRLLGNRLPPLRNKLCGKILPLFRIINVG